MHQRRYNKYLLKQKSMVGGILIVEDTYDGLSLDDVKRSLALTTTQPTSLKSLATVPAEKMDTEFNINFDFKEILRDISEESKLVGDFYNAGESTKEVRDILLSVAKVTDRTSEAVHALKFIQSDAINNCILESIKHGAKFKNMLMDEEKHKQVIQHIKDMTGDGYAELVESTNLEFTYMLADIDNADVHLTPRLMNDYVATNKRLLSENARPLALVDGVLRGGFDLDPDSRGDECDIYSVVGRLFTNENSLESALIECDSKMSSLIIITVNTVSLFIKKSTFGISEIIANAAHKIYSGDISSASDVARFVAKLSFIFCKIFLIKLFITLIINNTFVILPDLLVESVLDKYFLGVIVSKLDGVAESAVKFVYNQIREFINERFIKTKVTSAKEEVGATARVAEQYAEHIFTPPSLPEVTVPEKPSAFGEFIADAASIAGGLLEIPLLMEFLKTSLNVFKSKKGLGVLDPMISDPRAFYEYYKIPAYRKASNLLQVADLGFWYLGADQVFLKYMYTSFENISNPKLLGAIKFSKLENMCNFFTGKEMALLFEKDKKVELKESGIGRFVTALKESQKYDSRIIMTYVKLVHEEIRRRMAKDKSVAPEEIYMHDDYVKHKNELLCWRAHIAGEYNETTDFCRSKSTDATGL
jgi:hypothetical protein